jgi:hypothetical protein
VAAAAPAAHGATDHALDDDHYRASDDNDGTSDNDVDHDANDDDVPGAAVAAGSAGSADDHDDGGRLCLDDGLDPARTYTPGR